MKTVYHRIKRCYADWLDKPRPIPWILRDQTVVFAGLPSDAQIQAVLDSLKPLGLVSTNMARASRNKFELFLEPAEAPCE